MQSGYLAYFFGFTNNFIAQMGLSRKSEFSDAYKKTFHKSLSEMPCRTLLMLAFWMSTTSLPGFSKAKC